MMIVLVILTVAI